MVKKILLNITVLSMLALTACSNITNNSNNNNSNNSNVKTEQAKTAESSNTNNQKKEDSVNNKDDLSKVIPLEEQSNYLGTAIKVFQNTYPNLSITKVELKSGEKPYLYNITAVDNDKEYEYKYNSSLKSLNKEKEKQLSENENNGKKKGKESIDMTTTANVDNIFYIAIEKDSSKKIVAWNIEKENSKVIWKISVLSNNKISEVKVDDQTEAIVKN